MKVIRGRGEGLAFCRIAFDSWCQKEIRLETINPHYEPIILRHIEEGASKGYWEVRGEGPTSRLRRESMRTQELALSEFEREQEYPFCQVCGNKLASAGSGTRVKVLRTRYGGLVCVCHDECDLRKFFELDKVRNNPTRLIEMDVIVDGKVYRCFNATKHDGAMLRDESGEEITKDFNELSVEIDGETIDLG